MKRPSIDRIDTNGDYTLENCRYIEFSQNIKRPRAKRCLEQELPAIQEGDMEWVR